MSDIFPQLVHDPVSGDWVVVAPKRGKRPDGMKKPKDVFSVERLKGEKILATFGKGKRRIVAIENKFPTFEERRGVSGHQEILVEGADVGAFSAFSVAQMEDVLRAYAARTAEIRRMKGMACLLLFKNEGREAGASQPHAHSQIFALSFVPDRLQQMSASRKQLQKKGTSSHAETIWHALQPRAIYSDAFVTAFAHPAARFPYEVRIVPRRNFDNISQATSQELRSLAKALYALMPFIRSRKLSYNFYFHDVFADANEHFEIRFVPRGISTWGGFELDAGICINPVTAEQAAEAYRAAKK